MGNDNALKIISIETIKLKIYDDLIHTILELKKTLLYVG